LSVTAEDETRDPASLPFEMNCLLPLST
jgi:hypothetical protein